MEDRVERIVRAHLAKLPLASLPAGLDGAAGAALLASALGDRERARVYLDRAIAGAEELDAGLHSGVLGICWAAEHIDPERVAPNALPLLDELVDVPVWNSYYDLVYGLVGFGVYALGRLADPGAEGCVEHIVRHLEASAVAAGSGCAWHTDGRLVLPALKAADGGFDLGLAHGIPGVIAFLAACVRKNVAAKAARALLEPAVSWLLEQRLPQGTFPAFVARGATAPPGPTRTAWCYGDPGVAVALRAAGRALNRPAWEGEAIARMRAIAARPLECTGVEDAGICHGAAGLALMFEAFGESSAAHAWRERAVEWLETSIPDLGFLSGMAGVGLALLPSMATSLPFRELLLLEAHGP
ncbi:hypothetical protein LVJ94_13950 [Pendulispora rubella]|uniref:Lanthionine biosynthesis cyclase LanC n=1 Tax=Pendulispora rubella TaxID=2741070 RepID=A0ABZ2LDA3_9BACT